MTAVVITNFIKHLQDKLPFQNKDTAEISLAAVQFSQQTLDLERKNNINKKVHRTRQSPEQPFLVSSREERCVTRLKTAARETTYKKT